MNKYTKPELNEIVIEIEDVIAASSGTVGNADVDYKDNGNWIF